MLREVDYVMHVERCERIFGKWNETAHHLNPYLNLTSLNLKELRITSFSFTSCLPNCVLTRCV